ncbi:recombinase family protein [Aquimarina sp. Aq107]|uniref:recombinase family protein n=1 Tax=Aquimarina sp. Aq107 TaxID=1191912 RepID=UPI0020B310E7|nr:recombinase family protein [Aquimarina sp. Aq107]
MSKIKAVAYVRVSTKEQSLDRQKEEIQKYANENDYIIEKYFEDKVSSMKVSIDKRTGFNRLKKYLFDDNIKAKTLLVHEVSRLGRKNFEVQNVIEEFSQKRVNIHIMDMKQSTLNENGIKSPESNIIISILASMAENENRVLSDRIKGGLLSSAKKGFAFSSKITGYKKGEDKKPQVDEKEASIVRRIYELAESDTTLYFISKAIQEEFGKEINSKTISGIVKNPFYKGDRKYLEETIPVPPLVTKETWNKANEFLNKRKVFTKRYQVNVNVVEGKIECYNCGNPMYQVVIKKGRSNMFKCSKKCSKVTVNRPWLYEMIRYVVEKHTKKVNDEKFKNDLSKQIKENEQLEADLRKEKDKAESAQLRNYDMFLKEKVSGAIYEKMDKIHVDEINNISLQFNECLKKNRII